MNFTSKYLSSAFLSLSQSHLHPHCQQSKGGEEDPTEKGRDREQTVGSSESGSPSCFGSIKTESITYTPQRTLHILELEPRTVVSQKTSPLQSLEGLGMGAWGARWTLSLKAVTSRSGGLGGWDHPLLLFLSLTDVCPMDISLDCQGIHCVYDLLQPVVPSWVPGAQKRGDSGSRKESVTSQGYKGMR